MPKLMVAPLPTIELANIRDCVRRADEDRRAVAANAAVHRDRVLPDGRGVTRDVHPEEIVAVVAVERDRGRTVFGCEVELVGAASSIDDQVLNLVEVDRRGIRASERRVVDGVGLSVVEAESFSRTVLFPMPPCTVIAIARRWRDVERVVAAKSEQRVSRDLRYRIDVERVARLTADHADRFDIVRMRDARKLPLVFWMNVEVI